MSKYNERPLSVSERIYYRAFYGADYLIKHIIGKYLWLY